jgi:putative hydrolase of the HAD superfamily
MEISLLAFDADDTLWHNETYFRFTEDRFCELLAPYAEPDHLSERLLATERRNVELYGYGAKGFMLSLIETALEITEHRVPGETLAEILRLGKEILAQPVEVLDGAAETVAALVARLGVEPERVCMVGNSVKSDVLPALALGCRAVHVPYHLTWAMEVADAPVDHDRFARIESLHHLPALLQTWR